MSLFDKIFSKKVHSTRRIIDAEDLTEYGIRSYSHGDIVYFIIKPVNIAVLSQGAVQTKINALMNILKGIESAEILCLNSRESFESNTATRITV